MKYILLIFCFLFLSCDLLVYSPLFHSSTEIIEHIEYEQKNDEELGYFLFMPNQSDKFYNETEANNQLINIANLLLEKNLSENQILVYGHTAVAQNNIDPYQLSLDRALFIINNLVKLGVPFEWFSQPKAKGTGFWGDDSSEHLNRRVRIIISYPEPNIKLSESINTNNNFNFYNLLWILLFIIIIAFIILIIKLFIIVSPIILLTLSQIFIILCNTVTSAGKIFIIFKASFKFFIKFLIGAIPAIILSFFIPWWLISIGIFIFVVIPKIIKYYNLITSVLPWIRIGSNVLGFIFKISPEELIRRFIIQIIMRNIIEALGFILGFIFSQIFRAIVIARQPYFSIALFNKLREHLLINEAYWQNIINSLYDIIKNNIHLLPYLILAFIALSLLFNLVLSIIKKETNFIIRSISIISPVLFPFLGIFVLEPHFNIIIANNILVKIVFYVSFGFLITSITYNISFYLENKQPSDNKNNRKKKKKTIYNNSVIFSFIFITVCSIIYFNIFPFLIDNFRLNVFTVITGIICLGFFIQGIINKNPIIAFIPIFLIIIVLSIILFIKINPLNMLGIWSFITGLCIGILFNFLLISLFIMKIKFFYCTFVFTLVFIVPILAWYIFGGALALIIGFIITVTAFISFILLIEK